MGIGVSGQNGEPARRIGHVDTAKIHAQEVATILFLLMGGETALEVVLKLKVLFIPYSITNSFIILSSSLEWEIGKSNSNN